MTDRIEVVCQELQLVSTNSTGLGVLIRDAAGNALLASGAAVPTGAGYATGCLFINAGLTGLSDAFYVNAGDSETASFDVVYATPPAPPALTAYPLDDDGTLAAAFGTNALPTNAPAYLRADHTYTGTHAGGGYDTLYSALPSAANVLDSQAIHVGATDILACEFEVIAQSATSFQSVGMAAGMSTGGVFGTFVTLYISRLSGTPRIDSSIMAPGGAVRTGATNGFRLGLEFNGVTGDINIRTTDGDMVSTGTFTPGCEVTFYMFLQDSTSPNNAGETISIRLIPAAADMTLTYSTGAKDVFGDTI